jgi:phosphohistidine phosphatase
MKRILIIMRHAKSSWDNGSQSDHERPLNERGILSAKHVGECLAHERFRPQHAIVSDATRTTETWQEMGQFMPEVEPEFSRALYLGDLSDIRHALGRVDKTVTRLILLGHNPGFSLAAGWLSGDPMELKTAHAAVLEAEMDEWIDGCRPNVWACVNIITPKSPLPV